MKTFCLKYRGLGQPEAVQELRNLLELHRPMLVFLSETRYFDDKVDFLKIYLRFPNGLGVGSFGRGGGLVLLWANDVDVRLQSMNKSHIDMIVRRVESDPRVWRFTGFYGESKRELRPNSWALLKYLNSQLNLPWLCAGNFNEVLLGSEQLCAEILTWFCRSVVYLG